MSHNSFYRIEKWGREAKKFENHFINKFFLENYKISSFDQKNLIKIIIYNLVFNFCRYNTIILFLNKKITLKTATKFGM